MKKLGLHELRQLYLDFFEEKGHLAHHSFSLVPQNDKSLLLIGAGMAPLKKYFTGEMVPPRNRMVTCQKCIRTGDIDNVGITDRHGTFFEMLGNFSFGDYFKKEAIAWAWEFLTERLEINPEDLWVTIYLDDDEAYQIWNEEVGVPAERIVRLGKEDNFWELEVGPSGPCSEIYVDRGPEHGCGDPNCKPGCECDRFLEVWNLVFTQYDKDEEGNYHPLAHPNIDTGMGLERMTTILEGADNIFEVAAIRDIITAIEKLSHYAYKTDEKKDVSVRVITDHIRAATFLASDGVLPSNEGRGYVMRRIIRRAIRHGRLLGINDSFMPELAQVVIDSWQVNYPELKEKERMIRDVISAEERKFHATLDSGMEILASYMQEMKAGKKSILSGANAFKLYDTYGFPLDLVREIMVEKSFSVDEKGFQELMEEQRNRARASRDDGDNIGWSSQQKQQLKNYDNTFVGYETMTAKGTVLALYQDGEEVNMLKQEERGRMVLSVTPFYGESGGQVGDTGEIYREDGKAIVEDTQKTPRGTIYHIVTIQSGTLKVGDEVTASVRDARRGAIMRNHSATHLLHQALKDVLGDHVNQAGSEVGPQQARFDFTHFEGLTEEQKEHVERKVNEKILQSMPVHIAEMSMAEAKAKGAIGLFEDKYGDKVRVVDMGGYSVELCGGVHVHNTAEIGVFKLLSESSVASGVRRVEYMTSIAVLDHDKALENQLDDLAKSLKTTPQGLTNRVVDLQEELKELQRELDRMQREMAKESTSQLVDQVQEINGIPYVTAVLSGVDTETLRNEVDELKDKLGSVVVVLGSVVGDKLTFAAGVTKDLVKKGVHAGQLVKAVAQVTGGNGGGRPDMATAGGKDISKAEEALAEVKTILAK